MELVNEEAYFCNFVCTLYSHGPGTAQYRQNYGLCDSGMGVRVPVGIREVFPYYGIQTHSGADTAS
jgi:hypothetical protein